MANKIIAVLDYETDPFEYEKVPEPFAAGVYLEHEGVEIYEEFWGEAYDVIKDVVDYLKDKEWRVYAHNGGRFDFFFMIEYADEINVINGRIATMRIGKCLLVDSYLLLPMPLSSYKKDDIDYNIFKRGIRDRKSNALKIKHYLYKDCQYLYEWLQEWIDRFGITLTLASAAFKEVKKSGYKITQSTNIHWDTKFRDFYYGGRCEVFKPGITEGDYKYIDINSAYPFAMLEKHPYGYDMEYSNEIPESGVYFADIIAESKGALPLRDKTGLNFPHTTDNFFVSSWEINAGLRTGTLKILEVNRVYIPLELRDFKDYVGGFYKEKSEAKAAGDKTREMFAKLMLNSAYGKFALNSREFKAHEITPCGDRPEGEEWNPIYDNDDYTIWEKPDPQEKFYNVLTAASITGFVRAYLWEAICNSDDVLYCDTDSLVCKSHNVTMGKELGEWSLDGEIKKAHIAGKKLYCLETKGGEYKTASKGARLTPDEIMSVVRGEVVNWQNEAPSFSIRYGTRFINRDIRITGK